MYRPIKLRKIFASKACRKSIMFGTALTKQQMEHVIFEDINTFSPFP